MLFHARNETLKTDALEMDYIRFGTGTRNLVILPGLGDGLQTVKGTALPMAWMYRMFANAFTVYVFSRKNTLSEGYTTRDMAKDQAEAMSALGIGQTDIFAVSMGGMIAQHLAIDYPEKVGKLVLAVTAAGTNPLLKESVDEWMDLARKGDHAAFMDSNLRRIYSEAYCRKNSWLVPVTGLLTKPKSYDRFFIQANACLRHNAAGDLHRITAPTFVIGGEQDQALGGEASREIATAIPGARLLMYPQWGHGLYEEEAGFNTAVLDFLLE